MTEILMHIRLMEYGSVFGHGAYLGPDFTDDYLRRASNLVKRCLLMSVWPNMSSLAREYWTHFLRESVPGAAIRTHAGSCAR